MNPKMYLFVFFMLKGVICSFAQISESQQHFIDGNRFAKLLRWEEAIGEYSLAIEKNADYVEAYLARGKVYQIRGFNEKAMNDYNMAIKLNPNNPTFYDVRANLKMLMDNYTGAITDLNEAIRINPSDSITMLELGLAKLNNRNYDESVVEYSKSIEIYPEFLQAYIGRAAA
jgi:tetratricopeptide (TPR) repeat protein